MGLRVFAALVAFFALSASTKRAFAADFTVTATTTTAYLVNGTSNPTLNLVRGSTYTFLVNTWHPFNIQLKPGVGGTSYDVPQPDGTLAPVALNVANASFSFTVPANAPASLAYQCGIHGLMTGPISITGCATACPGDACNAGVCNADGTCGKTPAEQHRVQRRERVHAHRHVPGGGMHGQ